MKRRKAKQSESVPYSDGIFSPSYMSRISR